MVSWKCCKEPCTDEVPMMIKIDIRLQSIVNHSLPTSAFTIELKPRTTSANKGLKVRTWPLVTGTWETPSGNALSKSLGRKINPEISPHRWSADHAEHCGFLMALNSCSGLVVS